MNVDCRTMKTVDSNRLVLFSFVAFVVVKRKKMKYKDVINCTSNSHIFYKFKNLEKWDGRHIEHTGNNTSRKIALMIIMLL